MRGSTGKSASFFFGITSTLVFQVEPIASTVGTDRPRQIRDWSSLKTGISVTCPPSVVDPERSILDKNCAFVL